MSAPAIAAKSDPGGVAVGAAGASAAGLPPYLTALTQIALSPGGNPTALLLPETRRIAETVALLSARCLASSARKDISEMLASLQPGHRVRVLPDEGIYQFAGTNSEGFYLQLLDVKNKRSLGRMWVPLVEARRLEPTIRKRPMGTADRRSWAAAPVTPWDLFSNANVYGNAALTRVAVVLVGARSDFKETLEGGLGFAAQPGETAHRIGDGLPWGEIDDEGVPRVVSPPNANGLPVIAVARDHISARRFAANCAPGTLTVISTKTEDALGDRSSVDAIAERHAFLLVAPSRARTELSARRLAGWTVLELSGSSILEAKPTGVRFIDRVVTASSWMKTPPSVLAEPSTELERAFDALDTFGRTAGEFVEDDEDVAECASILRETFFDVSDWLGCPNDEELAGVAEAQNFVTKRRSRLNSVVGETASGAAIELMNAIAAFADKAKSQTLTPKGACLLRLATSAQQGGQYRQVITVGHGQTAKAVAVFLDSFGQPMSCVTPSELARRDTVDRINVLSMMRREAFARLVDPWAAPRMMFLGYRHETEIYKRRLAAREWQIRQLQVDDRILQRFPFLNGASRALGEAPDEPAPTVSEPLAPILRPMRQPQAHRPGEQIRPARFCRFAGRSWMAVTDDHSFARVQESEDKGTQIATVSGRDLQVGDVLLVREGSEKDIVREAAELQVGKEGYAKLRQRADYWRRALMASDLTPENLRRALAEHGLDRGLPTIRYWLADVGPIGPSDPHAAIPMIAAALGKQGNMAPWNQCLDAIHSVRRLHVEAGFRLTQILLAECGQSVLEHSEHETAFELSMGTVWLLEVEQLESRRPDWPVGQINRIVWESDSWKRRLLARQRPEQVMDFTFDDFTFLIDGELTT